MAPTWEAKPDSSEFRFAKVDDRATVDVGLPKQFGGKLGPGWRAEKWNGRGWLEISGLGVEVNRPGRIVSHAKLGDVYECECTRQARGRKRGERHIIVPGSAEYRIEWDAKNDLPEDDWVDLLLDFPGELTWHKQPALTQQEIDEGCERPENVINSYPIYIPQSGRILRGGIEVANFETGKFGHLYRSQLIDANGNRLWLDQTAPLTNPNRLRVYLDREWLSGATYPVTLDPTFGYTSAGGSYYDPHATVQANGPWLGAAGTVTSLHGYLYSPFFGRSARLGLYSDDSGPDDLLASNTVGLTQGATNWYQVVVSVVISATNYHLAMQRSSTGVRTYYDWVSGAAYYTKANTYSDGFPNPFGAPDATTAHRKLSLYATYEEAAAGNPHRKRLGGVKYAAHNHGVW